LLLVIYLYDIIRMHGTMNIKEIEEGWFMIMGKCPSE